jgi:predicted short-subunit dehydrogenase-like oxidoreductase (DUF2520 family)
VAANLASVGLPRALSGPVRRGDAQAVAAHLEVVRGLRGTDLEWFDTLYRASVRAQLGLAKAIGEADEHGLGAIQALVDRAAK